MRSIFSGICLISLVAISCNDDEVNRGSANAGQEGQLKALVNQYPDSLALRNKLVDYFAGKGDYDNAIRETNFMLQKDSNDATVWNAKARLHFLNEDTIGAITAFQKVISISPDPKYMISLGTLYAQKTNPLALAMADSILLSPSANAALQGYFIKGLFYNYSGDNMKAISFFDKCLSIDYKFLDAYLEKGIALYEIGKYADALQLLKKATTVQSTFDEGYYWMGRCYEKSGKRKEAIDSYQIALQIDPGYVEAKEALANLGIN